MDIIATGLQFPEGPVAMADGSIILVEIARETLSRVTADGRVEVIANMPGGPNGAALGPGGKMYICNNGGFAWIRDRGTTRPILQNDGYIGGSIQVVDLHTGKFETMYTHCGDFALRGPNDIVFDAHGGFWFTDLGKRRPRDMDRGFVYWARDDGSEIREVIGPIMTPNGVGLSPDGNRLYVAETETGRVWSFEITAPGEIRQRPFPSPHGGTLVTGFGGYVRLDSLAIAASGNVCVAALNDGSVLEVSPDGALTRRHPMPDIGVTNICFGGPDLRTAYITLSHEGKLGAMDWHEPGLRLRYQQ
ncbi:MAG: SMP-30/gluconolactonase/LRE family protein [Casimicrobiaceae bacterium]